MASMRCFPNRDRQYRCLHHRIRSVCVLYQRTLATIHNFTRTTAEASQERLIRELDEAHFKVATGAASYTQAVQEAVKSLATEQVKVRYPSGHVDTIETAVLRAVRTGVAQAAGNMAVEGMIERDWDVILVSAHIGARYGDGGPNPGNHFWWQGKFYTRTGRTPDLSDFEKSTGYGTGEGLCGWNCRHSFGPGDLRHNPYEQFDAEENKRVYDLSQRQRRMERDIRHTKDEMIGLKQGIDACTDPETKAALQEEYDKKAEKLGKRNQAYNEFCEKNGLKRYDDRLAVARWDREQAKKSIMATRKEVAKPGESDIIEKTEEAGVTSDVHFVGNIDRDTYSCVTPDIATDEVIITDERIQHVRDHHPGSYELFAEHLREIVEDPDYILEANKPNSGTILKEVLENGERIKLVLRLKTSTDTPHYKNSIITFNRIDQQDWDRLVRRKKVLYKKG